MKITQQFNWEATHRHAVHALHRHAFRMTVQLSGSLASLAASETVAQVLDPLIAHWNDAVLVAAYDDALQQQLAREGRKYALLPRETTAEALSRYATDYFCLMAAPHIRSHGVEAVQVRVDSCDPEPAAHPAEHGFARATFRTDRYGSAKWGRAA